MTQQLTLFDALNNRRKALVSQLGTEKVRGNSNKLQQVARELREISKRLEAFTPNETN